MNKCPHFTHLLVFPRLRVQNANAFSSPLTHGFPSMTAFLGLMWALARRANDVGLNIAFKAVGVVCHDYEEQVFKDQITVWRGAEAQNYTVNRFSLTRNPLGRDGKPTSILEEGRAHLELSLILGVTSEVWAQEPARSKSDVNTLAEILLGMRIAGGSILEHSQPDHPRYRPSILDLTGTEEDRRDVFRKGRARLLPGFSLVARPDLIQAQLAELQEKDSEATRLEAWLSIFRLSSTYQFSDESKKNGTWVSDKKGSRGWIVPIPVGYAALDKRHSPNSVAGVRDPRVPVSFVEPLYSVGEWASPHRFHSAEQLLWYPSGAPDEGHYLCRNDYFTSRNIEDFDYEDFD